MRKFKVLAIVIVVLTSLVCGYLYYSMAVINPRVAKEISSNPDGERAGIVGLFTLPSGRKLPANYLREGNKVFVGVDGRWWRELTGGENGWNKLHAVYDSIQTTLQQTDQGFRCITLHTNGFVIGTTELFFGDVAVIAFQLLLGAQLNAVITWTALAGLTMLTGAIITDVYRAFGATPKVDTEGSVNLVFSFNTFAHVLCTRLSIIPEFPVRPMFDYVAWNSERMG